MTAEPTDADRATAHRIWNEALCNSGIPNWDRDAAFAQALADAREEGRQSVGLGDFLPNPCGEETRVAYAHDYGWLRCNRRAGHDGDHEEGSSGYTWSSS